MPVTQVHTVPPLKVTGFMFSVWAYQVLNSAMELDMFTALKGSKSTASELAARAKLDERATRLMLDALTSMELLKKSGERYELTDVAENYLVKDSPLYFGNFLNMRSVHKDSWEKLSDTVRTGKPQNKVNQQSEGEKFFKEL